MSQLPTRNDPLDRLSLEDQAAILSYLPESELLNTALVSRSWRNRVVELGPIRWRCTLQTYMNRRGQLTLKLPYYAKKLEAVHFKFAHDEKLCAFLRALREKGCAKIRQITLADCTIKNPTDFLDALGGPIAENLHAFAITSSKTALTPPSILKAFPKLRVLYYDIFPLNGATGFNAEEPPVLSNDVQFTQLTCLSIHGSMRESQLREILEKTPNLRCIRLCAALRHDAILNPTATWPRMVDLDVIEECCPKIEHIEFNRTQYKGKVSTDAPSDYDEMAWWTRYVEMDPTAPTNAGLRAFKYIESEERDVDPQEQANICRLFKILQKSQHTLLNLHLGNIDLSVKSIDEFVGHEVDPSVEICDVSDLSFPKLRELAFIGEIQLENNQLYQWLTKSPELESFELSVAIKGLHDERLPNTVASLKALKSLSFKMPNWYDLGASYHFEEVDFNCTNEKQSITRILEAVAESSDCRLESVCLGGHTCGDTASINGIGLTDELLDAVAKIKSLRKVRLHHHDLFQQEDAYEDDYGMDELRDFEVAKIGLKNFSKSIKKSQIEELWLEGIDGIPTAIFGSLGKMHSLKTLHTGPGLHIDGKKLFTLFGTPARPRYKGKLIVHEHLYGIHFAGIIQKYEGKVIFCNKECSSRKPKSDYW